MTSSRRRPVRLGSRESGIAGSAHGELLNLGSNKCLDVTGGTSANNTLLQIWDCNSTAAQKWTLESGGRVRGLASKCAVSGRGLSPRRRPAAKPAARQRRRGSAGR
ncbi:RICIN domain-containing protein [Archangium gephyra]|nr:RICIN domain-containing protein [Archangium gephyra]